MKHFIMLLCVVTSLFLAGCTTEPVAPAMKAVVIAPTDVLLVDCSVEAPPPKGVFLSMTDAEQKKALWEMDMKQMENLFACNARFSELRVWKKEQLELIASKNKGTK